MNIINLEPIKNDPWDLAKEGGQVDPEAGYSKDSAHFDKLLAIQPFVEVQEEKGGGYVRNEVKEIYLRDLIADILDWDENSTPAPAHEMAALNVAVQEVDQALAKHQIIHNHLWFDRLVQKISAFKSKKL